MAKNPTSNLSRIFCVFVFIVFILLFFPLYYGCSGENGSGTNTNNNTTNYEYDIVVQHIKNKGAYSNDGYSISVREGKYLLMLRCSQNVISLACSYSEGVDTAIFTMQIRNMSGQYSWTTLYSDYRMGGALTASDNSLALDYSNYPASMESSFLLASYDFADLCVKYFSGILYYDIGSVAIEDFGFSSKYSVKYIK
ncbi:MAG: hypothetical protein IK147_04265 [Clostridia bacterium]|nr:hypothetical protein [Clostridia bacterium]